jgi:AAA+ superfamily predicted ATPase
MEKIPREGTRGLLHFRKQLAELIRARTSLLYLGSIEIRYSLEELKMVSSEARAEIQVFNVATGLLESKDKKATTDPVGVLDTILRHSREGALGKQTLWVLPFFHLLLRESDALIISKLRHIIEFSKFKDTVIIIGLPGAWLPPELSDIPVIDLPLPNRQEIRSLLDYPLSEEGKNRIEKACLGFQMGEIEDLVSMSLVRKGRLDPSTIESLRAELIRKKGNGLVDIEFPADGLDQVGGMEALKAWLERRKCAFLDPEKLKGMNLPAPKGIFLMGVQGCGKSLVCKAVAASWGLPLLRLDPARLYSPSLGASERNLQAALQFARSVSPCVFWIDELEKGFSPTDSRTDGGVSGRVLGTFLNFLQDPGAPIFFVATSNDLSPLPPEMLRKGRWDEIFFIDLPHPGERRSIFETLLRKYRLEVEVDEDLLSLSQGFSGAEIEQSIINAGYDALFRNTPVHSFDIKRALREIIPFSKTMKVKIEFLRSWGNRFARSATHEEKRPRPSSNLLPMQSREEVFS